MCMRRVWHTTQALDKPPDKLTRPWRGVRASLTRDAPTGIGLLAMELADRMKLYEDIGAGQRLIPNLPVCIRLDGKAFHQLDARVEAPV